VGVIAWRVSRRARPRARMLKPYGIKPEKLRVGDHTFRGYRRADFKDAWMRYAPAPLEEVEHLEHPEHPADRADSDVPHKRHVPEHRSDVEQKAPHKQQDVPRVSLVPPNPGSGEHDSGLAGGKCVHDVLGGCWLCKKYDPEKWGEVEGAK
jgi:hypothetical protein